MRLTFKSDVKDQIVKNIDNLDQIEGAILGAMNRINKKYEDTLKGWVSAEFLDQLEKLREENTELSKKALAKTEEAAELKEAASIIETEKIGSYNINALVKLLNKINVNGETSLKEVMLTKGHILVEPKAYKNINDTLLKEAIPKLIQYRIVESEEVEIFDFKGEYEDTVNGYVLSNGGVELLTHLEYISILEEEEVNNA
ncbi:hypothetical protein [Candidatus Enterococcus clewellii]|uniref:Uncharacterized protein n=1 Tax=Candidatus Enterococcus clewellii TaxID=1834193 RepID=A0AAQ3VXD3_9ENTE